MLIKVENVADEALPDCELVDILRAMSAADRDSVMGRQWLLAALDLVPYQLPEAPAEERRVFLPGESAFGDGAFIIAGGRLMERSAVLYQVVAGLFMRIVDPAKPVVLEDAYRLCGGPPRVQASNVDLEIRRSDGLPYEIITADKYILSYLEWRFVVSKYGSGR